MSTRREFLQWCGLAAASAIGSPVLFAGCAGQLTTYRTEVRNNRIQIPRQEAAVLEQPDGLLLVQARGVTGPIFLRNVDGDIIALSSICTHRGCEVRALPDLYQCPCHGSEYDIDGEVLAGPASQALRRFEVKQLSGSLMIDLTSAKNDRI